MRKDIGGIFVLVSVAVMFLFVPAVQAVDVDVHLGIKQVSVMDGAGEHFVVAGFTVFQQVEDFTVSATVMGDYANEVFNSDNHFRADGTFLELGAVHKIGEKSDVALTLTKDNPFTHLDTETIQLMANIRF